MQADDVITVGELDRRLRRAVEVASDDFWIEGEVASLKAAPSGHVYFTLKDEREDAVIDCVMYRFDAQRARRILTEGARLQLKGRATVWAPRGRLQLVGTLARLAGRGELLLALEKLKEQLAKDGLFDAARKRALPRAPRIIGVVTSGAGAAFHDIRTVAFRRGGVRLVLAPALVQGDSAALSIVAALDLLERYPGLDALIVGRGGGSGEDLMAFNDERVVRRVARCRVPVVSAVGHEIDVTLTDLVADVRAATPSQAAELLVPDTASQREALLRCERHLLRAQVSFLAAAHARMSRLTKRVTDPRFVIASRQEELDDLSERMAAVTRQRFVRGRRAQHDLMQRLAHRHPERVLGRARAELASLSSKLTAAVRLQMGIRRESLVAHAAELDALSPLAVLGRGYAIATREGLPVLSSQELSAGDAVSVRVAHGSFRARVTHVEAPAQAQAGAADAAPVGEVRS
ncbi:MAG TPA: exodeoxyribonuclease VII large subunit [Polyangiaceae bacterium]|nr:exodeoxyribonuclease VII large subunit [Polyangiaceae bacterium]